jgi:hypothetical protein
VNKGELGMNAIVKLEIATAPLPVVDKESSKGELRALAEAALAQFLARGGTVTVLPPQEI